MLSIRLSSISAKRFPAGKATHRPFLDRSRPCRLCSGVRLVSARGRGWDAGCRAPRRRPACLVRRRIIPAPAAIRARRALPSSPPPALNRRKAAGAFSQRGFVAHPTVACCAHDAPPARLHALPLAASNRKALAAVSRTGDGLCGWNRGWRGQREASCEAASVGPQIARDGRARRDFARKA